MLMLNRLMDFYVVCESCEMMICINQCVGVKKQNKNNNNNNKNNNVFKM